MRDFWLSCGHHLLDRDAGGGLVTTDEFLKAYLARPELAPPPEACVVEKTLHSALLSDPLRPVAADEIAAIADPDARENWQLMIEFRDHLLAHATLEASYMALVRRGPGHTPPLFINQLVHAILRNVLDGCTDAYVLRAAELFFRPQRMTVHEGSLLAADEERIAGSDPAPVSPLVSMLGLEKSAVDVEPVIELRDASLTWYVGLDAEGTRIGDMLWNGDDLGEAARARVIGLFRLRFRERDVVAEKFAGEPVYLILAMTADNILRMKPQNLVTGLPVRHTEAAT